MYSIQTLNKISSKGLNLLPRENFEVASEINNPDAVIARSYKMHDMEIPPTVKAIARAGAGVNNIPVEKCSGLGIVVFNTPGANANSVKELVLTGLFISSRKIFRAMSWAQTLIGKEDEVPKLIEKGKGDFTGPEIKGKTLGVIGLGAIGVQVANSARDLGMNVLGYDPYISIDAAWGLSRNVKRAPSMDQVLAEADYLTLHMPLNDDTKGLINKDKLRIMKKGIRILNFARGGLVHNADLIEALKAGIVERYVTDFPDEEMLKQENVMAIPHLGASTPEAEENCAIMAAEQLKDFLETGNIINSVNFPSCSMEFTGFSRLLIANRNVPNMIGQISTLLAEQNINIQDLVNKHKEDLAYNIIDISEDAPQALLDKLNAIDGILMVRAINRQ